MNNPKLFVPAMLLGGLLSACGNGGGGGNEIAAFSAHCQATSNLGPEICDCVAQKASEELPPIGMQILMEPDQTLANNLRSQLTVEGAMQTGMFMVRAPAECAAGE